MELRTKDRERLPWEFIFVVSEHAIGDCPFSPDGASVSLLVKVHRVTEWFADNGTAAIPPSTVSGAEQAKEELLLIPYGCTNLTYS